MFDPDSERGRLAKEIAELLEPEASGWPRGHHSVKRGSDLFDAGDEDIFLASYGMSRMEVL